MFWMESPWKDCYHTQSSLAAQTRLVTSVFSTSAIIAPDPRQDERCVPNDLPGQLQPQGRQEAQDPGVEVLRAPGEVEDQSSHHQAEAVRVKHVAGGLGGVPLSRGDIKTPATTSVLHSH